MHQRKKNTFSIFNVANNLLLLTAYLPHLYHFHILIVEIPRANHLLEMCAQSIHPNFSILIPFLLRQERSGEEEEMNKCVN